MARKYVSKGNPRKKHVMHKRQNMDAKRSTETPVDKNGRFWNSSDLKDWYGCKATSKMPCLF